MGQQPISLQVDARLKEALELEAQLSNATESEIASEALEKFLSYQRRKRAMLTEAAAELDKGVFISGAAIERWMDSWDTDDELPPPEPDIFLPPR